MKTFTWAKMATCDIDSDRAWKNSNLEEMSKSPPPPRKCFLRKKTRTKMYSSFASAIFQFDPSPSYNYHAPPKATPHQYSTASNDINACPYTSELTHKMIMLDSHASSIQHQTNIASTILHHASCSISVHPHSFSVILHPTLWTSINTHQTYNIQNYTPSPISQYQSYSPIVRQH